MFLDSSLCLSAGEMWAIMTVLQLPDRGSLRSRVNFESRQLTNLLLPSASAFMQFPRASSERLMWAPSFSRLPRFCFQDEGVILAN